MKIRKINNFEYVLEAHGISKHIEYYDNFDVDSLKLNFVDGIKFGRPNRVLNAFMERSIIPKDVKTILLIGYGTEDYITPFTGMKADLLDIADNKQNLPNYYQLESVNVEKIGKKYDCALIGAGSIELCEKNYFIQTIKNCLRVSPLVITSVRMGRIAGKNIEYHTGLGDFNFSNEHMYIYGEDNVQDFAENFGNIDLLAKDCDTINDIIDCRIRMAIHE